MIEIKRTQRAPKKERQHNDDDDEDDDEKDDERCRCEGEDGRGDAL